MLLTTAKKSTQKAGFVRPVSSNSKGLVEFKNKKVETLSPSFLNETVAFACHTIINIRQKVHKGIISVRNPPTTQVLKAVRYRLKSYSPKFPNAEEKCKQKIPGLYFITAALLQRIFVWSQFISKTELHNLCLTVLFRWLFSWHQLKSTTKFWQSKIWQSQFFQCTVMNMIWLSLNSTPIHAYYSLKLWNFKLGHPK